MIGTLGRKIIFEVSDNRVLTFESMSREVSGRWTEHEVLGVKPKAEFLGPGLQTISLTIHLSAALGVKPRRILDMVERMVERGTAEYLVIGGRLVGRRPFRVTGSSEAWDKVYSRGELAKANLTYYINRSDSARAVAIQAAVAQAVEEYKTWQRTIGRDVNPSQLAAMVMEAGAKRVTVTAPTFAAVAATKVAALAGSATVTYGGLEDD